MDEAVTSSINMPHFIKTSPHERLTTIAVDPSVPTASGESADVMFVGTTRGRVLKLASYQIGGVPRTTLIEELQVFPLHVSVNNILIVRSGEKPRVVVLSDHEVKSLPVERCHSANIRSCEDCVGLQDPYCAWNIQKQHCETHQGSKQDSSSLLQNIAKGFHPGCGVSSSYPGKASSCAKLQRHFLRAANWTNFLLDQLISFSFQIPWNTSQVVSLFLQLIRQLDLRKLLS